MDSILELEAIVPVSPYKRIKAKLKIPEEIGYCTIPNLYYRISSPTQDDGCKFKSSLVSKKSFGAFYPKINVTPNRDAFADVVGREDLDKVLTFIDEVNNDAFYPMISFLYGYDYGDVSITLTTLERMVEDIKAALDYLETENAIGFDTLMCLPRIGKQTNIKFPIPNIIERDNRLKREFIEELNFQEICSKCAIPYS